MLRGINTLKNFVLDATDGEIGHVEDFLLDDTPWTIRYMIIDTRNWLPGRKVVISPLWTNEIDWLKERLCVDLTREKIKNSPEYYPDNPMTREYEKTIHEYYQYPLYWT